MARTCFIVVGRYVAEPKLKFAMINAGPVMSAQTTRCILFETKAGKVVKMLLINEFLQGEATRFILSLLGLDILLKTNHRRDASIRETSRIFSTHVFFCSFS